MNRDIKEEQKIHEYQMDQIKKEVKEEYGEDALPACPICAGPKSHPVVYDDMTNNQIQQIQEHIDKKTEELNAKIDNKISSVYSQLDVIKTSQSSTVRWTHFLAILVCLISTGLTLYTGLIIGVKWWFDVHAQNVHKGAATENALMSQNRHIEETYKNLHDRLSSHRH